MRMVVFRSKNWNKIAEMPNTYKEFCFCAFMDDIFTFGGAKGGKRIAVDSCFQYSATSNRWKEAAELRAAQFLKRILSGGCSVRHFATKTVFLYDVAADECRPMPSMRRVMCHHILVVVRSKLFVVGSVVGSDSAARDKLVLLKCPPLSCLLNAF